MVLENRHFPARLIWNVGIIEFPFDFGQVIDVRVLALEFAELGDDHVSPCGLVGLPLGNFKSEFSNQVSHCEKDNWRWFFKAMFTGLVESLGSIVLLQMQPPGALIGIESGVVAEDVKIGDSISVNGCCLTVVESFRSILFFEAVEETLSKTNLGERQIGNYVNLERSLKIGDRLGGHYVSGHIDGLATVDAIEPGEKWATYWFRIEPQMSKFLAPKASIAIDGVSLTLVDVELERFSVALIPHTLGVTTLGNLHPEDTVNIETDILAKYVARQIEFEKNFNKELNA